MEVLPEDVWRRRAAAHVCRVNAWVGPHLDRRRRGEQHPVEDFLFGYYSHRPAALRRWHPGFGYALAGGDEYLVLKGYEGSPPSVTEEHLRTRERLLRDTRDLLRATSSRPANLACFGLHEWAMVYRLPPGRVRHSAFPLRLGSAATDSVVESSRVGCSHFDAFRFFAPDALARNVLQPGPHDRSSYEQPGCLHAGMDLYKHAFRLTPLVASELVAECFELAREIRELDMRASPYDLSDLGYEAVRIETADGKQQYVEAQREFARQAAPLRQRLLTECERLLRAG